MLKKIEDFMIKNCELFIILVILFSIYAFVSCFPEYIYTKYFIIIIKNFNTDRMLTVISVSISLFGLLEIYKKLSENSENLQGTAEILTDNNIDKRLICIKLNMTNKSEKFVGLQFVESMLYNDEHFKQIAENVDVGINNSTGNSVIHPIILNNTNILQKFIFMKDKDGVFHRSIAIPPNCDNFVLYLYVTSGKEIEDKIKNLTIQTVKNNYFTFNVK